MDVEHNGLRRFIDWALNNYAVSKDDYELAKDCGNCAHFFTKLVHWRIIVKKLASLGLIEKKELKT